MEILSTIFPIFILMAIGWVARKNGFIPPEFLSPGNRITYYLAIPALIFRAISKGSFTHQFNVTVLFITLGSASTAYFIAWAVCLYRRTSGSRTGSFIQSAGHGNLGYIGLPVSFYFLGDSGLIQTSIIAGFLMILQNVFSVFFLQIHAAKGEAILNFRDLARRIVGNPVIVSAMSGILFSVLELPVPQVFQRTLDMLGGLAPPMALLLIGASLSLDGLRNHFRPVMGAVVIKLGILPAIGLMLYTYFNLKATEFLPGFILLACPTATIAYVMSKEMKADPDFAVSTISASTLLSAGTFTLWLMFIHFLILSG